MTIEGLYIAASLVIGAILTVFVVVEEFEDQDTMLMLLYAPLVWLACTMAWPVIVSVLILRRKKG